MDKRTALAPGTVLKLYTKTGCTAYTIAREIGRGGSCIVYEATFTDNLGYSKPVHIKECYPHALKIRRTESGALEADPSAAEQFSAAKERLIAAYRTNHALFELPELANRIESTSNIYRCNETVYIVSVYGKGRTFQAYQGRTLHECISLLAGAAKILEHMHKADYLYLDLKPENILTLEGTGDCVQLFDFDSVVSVQEIQSGHTENIRASYTRGYAPIELQTGKLHLLSAASDLFSLGAVLFFALWGHTPTAFDCDPDARYDFESMRYSEVSYQDALYWAVSEFLHHTLNSYYADRYATAGEAIAQLQKILALSDPAQPWLISTPIPANAVFFGRETEILSLQNLLNQNSGHVVNLCGLGGIGKSTLVRQYLKGNRTDWDAVFWLYDAGNMKESVADDACIQIHTVHRMPEESTEDYFSRKCTVLRDLAKNKRILLVLDNFDVAHVNQLKTILNVGWTMLLISREKLPEGFCPRLHIDEMESSALQKLFLHYAQCPTEDPDEIQNILFCINGHTLLAELIARQIHQSYLTVADAQRMIMESGLSMLPNEKIDYIRDASVLHGGIPKILDQLMEIDRFTENEKCCMKALALFDLPGIDANLFRTLAELADLAFANALERLGWLKREKTKIYLHPVMLEYVRAWPWWEEARKVSDRMMRNLYERIRPAGTKFDGNRQEPENYAVLFESLKLAEQMVLHAEKPTEASQRLQYRCLVDAPVDQDVITTQKALDLLKHPDFLDSGSVLRLYETSAYLLGRVYAYPEAYELLGKMKRYLAKHPSAYYLSAYHRAIAVLLHNEDYQKNFSRCLRHQSRAIASVRLSSHPEAQKQLAACLLSKSITLLSADKDIRQVRKLLDEAAPLISRCTATLDFERYQFNCVSAMFCAMQGNLEKAEHFLNAADRIAFQSPDSDLSTVEHLSEQVAPIRMRMQQLDRAEEALQRAIALCDRHEAMARYRSTRFDAYLFLADLYAQDGKYILSEQTYAQAEAKIEDSPWALELPLCPAEIHELADRERKK